MGWVITAIIATAIAALVYYALYQVVAKGWELPIHIYDYLKGLYGRYSRKRRVKERLFKYETVSGMHKPSLLGTSVVLSVFTVVILLLLFKMLFFAVVTTDSMRPTFARGDLVFMQRIHVDPRPGDIIMYDKPAYTLPITHRVIEVTDWGVKTKGDARTFADPWVIPKQEIKGEALQVGGKPIVIKSVGNYFILDPSKMGIGRFGSEYLFAKKILMTIKMYGYAICIIALMGYLILTLREMRC